MDLIQIDRLKCNAIIGCNPDERTHPQPLYLTVTLEGDWSKAKRSDDLADTVDYAALGAQLKELVESSQCRLLEHLASLCASKALSCAHGAKRVTIRLEKPQAIPGAENAVFQTTME